MKLVRLLMFGTAMFMANMAGAQDSFLQSSYQVDFLTKLLQPLSPSRWESNSTAYHGPRSY